MKSNVIPIYISGERTTAEILAINALIQDLEKVTGLSANINSIDEIDKAGIIIINSKRDLLVEPIKGYESHRVYSCMLNNVNHIVLQGADMRGTIYAIYTYCEEVLGVPPLWYYSHWEPESLIEFTVPENLDIYYDSPYTKYRAWLPNDMNYMGPWRRRSETNNRIWLETALRLKINTIEWLDSGRGDEGGYRSLDELYTLSETAYLIQEYGLVYTSSHHNPLNASFQYWNKYWRKVRKRKPPKLLLKNLDYIIEYWRYNIECAVKVNLESLWVIGFRANYDGAFWNTFKDAPKSMQKRADIIKKMLEIQMELVIEITDNKDAQFRTILYDEMSDLVADGLLELPQNNNLTITYCSARRDHYLNDDILSLKENQIDKLGFYMNLQFTSTGSHRVAAEGPWKMEHNFRFADSRTKSPLNFSVVNAGNIREHVMELSAYSKMMWDMESFNSDNFLQGYCKKYFGQKYKNEIAKLYKAYYDAYWLPKKTDSTNSPRQYIFHDYRYAKAIRILARNIFLLHITNPFRDLGNDKRFPGRTFRIEPRDNDSLNQVEAVITGTNSSLLSFKEVVKEVEDISRQLPSSTITFFKDNLLVPALFMLYMNEDLNCLARASSKSKSLKEKIRFVMQANKANHKAIEILKMLNHGHFKNWNSHKGLRRFIL